MSNITSSIRFRILSLALFAASLIVPATVHAQLAVYAGFSGAPLSGASSNWAPGGLVGIYKQSGHGLGTVSFGGDLRGSFLTRDGFHSYTGAIGPRLSIKAPILPLRPYVEGLVGLGNVQNNNAGSHTNFNYQLVGGLDTTILPRIDWRVVEFAYSAVPTQSVNAKILTTGLVLRIW
ncbi:MAG TPA: hypothetical protein VGB69_07840 [Edaphobacter sp.]